MTGQIGDHGGEHEGPESPRHRQDPLTRFSGRGKTYHASRPSLPPQIVDEVLARIDLDHCTIVDLGAGTGLAAELLATRLRGDSMVIAVEPTDDMRAAAVRHPRIRWLSATAEQTDLPSASADVVVSVTAFHWFSPETAPLEVARILRPGGSLAVLATDRDPIDTAATEFHRLIGETPDSITPESIDRWYGHAFLANRYGPVRRLIAENPQEFDLARLLARAESSSYWPRGAASQHAARDAVEQLWRTHQDQNGVLRMRYRTVGLLARRC